MANKVVTGRGRLSYVWVFAPRPSQDGKDPKYQLCFILPKSDKATVERVRKAIEVAKEEGKAMWGGKIPAILHTPLRDGDTERDSEEFKGCWFLNASSKNKPGVVDVNLNPILDSSELYSGCYARVSLNFFPYTNAGNRGVGVGLNNIQKLDDGEPLGGARARPEDDFATGDDFLN